MIKIISRVDTKAGLSSWVTTEFSREEQIIERVESGDAEIISDIITANLRQISKNIGHSFCMFCDQGNDRCQCAISCAGLCKKEDDTFVMHDSPIFFCMKCRDLAFERCRSHRQAGCFHVPILLQRAA